MEAGANNAAPPGDVARRSLDLLGEALDALAARTRLEPAVSSDLERTKEPILRALGTAGASFRNAAAARLDGLDERDRADFDELLTTLAVPDLLEAAAALGRRSEGQQGSSGRGGQRSRAAGGNPAAIIPGVPGIPGIDIIKEIIELIKDLFLKPDDWSHKILDLVLKLINKVVGGKPTPGTPTPGRGGPGAPTPTPSG